VLRLDSERKRRKQLVYNSEIYASKIIYQDLARVIPRFREIEVGNEFAFPKGENPSIVLKATPGETLRDRIEQVKKEIETPYPALTQISREVVGGLMHLSHFSVNLLWDYFKMPNLEAQMKGDFNLCILDFKNQMGYGLTINHRQGRAILSEAFEVQRQPDGNIKMGNMSFLDLADLHEVIVSPDFSKRFRAGERIK